MELDPLEFLAVPSTFPQALIGLRNSTSLSKEKCHGVFRGRDRVRVRCVDNHYTAFGRGFEVNVINAYSCATDHDEIWRCLDHLAVERFVTPEEFDELGAYAESIGFDQVASGPMVRSSYHADLQAESILNT